MVAPDAAHPADAPCTVHGHRCKIPPDPLLGIFHSHKYISSGAFGRVYASRNSSDKDVTVALKVISKCTLGISSVARHALRSEIDIQRALDHPNIVSLRHVHQDRLRIYLVLDLVSGPCLGSMLSSHGTIPESFARVYFAHLCRGLHYLHTRQAPVLHRDIKPANILLSEDRSTAFLCDFGLAQTTEPGGGPTELMLVGTPNFLPPELLEDGNRHGHDLKASMHKPRMHPCPLSIDCYAAGVVLFIMLFGVAPFDGVDVPRTFRRIRAGRISFPSNIKISSQARNLIKSLLSRSPAARPTISAVLKHPFLNAAGSIPRPISNDASQVLQSSGSNSAFERRDARAQATDVREKSYVIDPVLGVKILPDDRRTEAVSRGLAHPPGSRLRANSSAIFKVDQHTACPPNTQRIRQSSSLFSKTERGSINGEITPNNINLENSGNGQGQCTQRRLRSDLSNNQKQLEIDDLLCGNHGSSLGRVDNENFSAVANERGSGWYNAAKPGKQTNTSVSSAHERRSNLTSTRHESAKRSMLGSEYLAKPDGHRPDMSDQSLSSRLHQRHNSISRCVALYNAMLQKLNSGLLEAHSLLEADSKSSQGHKAAQSRFQRVARHVAANDPNQPMMVERWLDLSSSCGFATKLSDGRTGCCFNDSSIMFNWSLKKDLPDVAYTSASNRHGHARQIAPRARSTSGTESDGSSQSRNDHEDGYAANRRYESIGHAQAIRATFRSSSAFRTEVSDKAKMLCRFREVLDSDENPNNRSQGDALDEDSEADFGSGLAGGPSSCSISFLAVDNAAADPQCTESLLKVRGLDTSKLVHVRGWQRYNSPRAVAFRMSNDSIHIKIDVGTTRGEEISEEDFVLDARRQIVYYRATDGNAWECRLQDIAGFCFSKKFHVRLAFCSRVLSRFVSN